MNPMDPMPIEGGNTEVTPGTVDPERAAAALEKLTALGGDSFNRSQMDELKAKLAKLAKSDQKTSSGSEAPVEGPKDVAQPGRPLTGRDVDWSEYNLDFNVAHLYQKAVYRDTPQGPKWVAMVTDFMSTTRDFRGHGKTVNAPGSVDKMQTEPLNLGEYLNDMVNGREQWKIAAVMPTGTQCGILLEREVPIILPDPTPLKKSEEVEVPTDQALVAVEDAALAFMNEQNEVDNSAEMSDHTSATTDVGLRPIEKGSAAHEAALAQLDERGAVEARRPTIVKRALEVAAPMTVEAPQAGLVTPEPVHNPLIQAPVPAAGYSAAQDLLRALSDPNFRASLSQEE